MENWKVNPLEFIPAPLATDSLMTGFVTVNVAAALVTRPARFVTTTV
jgi:hypothetical protein